MGEGDFPASESGYRRPGQMRWPGATNDGTNVPQGEGVTSTEAEVQGLYGRSGNQNVKAKPPIRFMEGEQDPLVPNTRGRVWEAVDENGIVRKVHGRPHWQLPAPMARDKSRTMEDNERAAEERATRGNSTGPTADDIASQRAANRQEAIRQEVRIRQYTDWAPNVVGNDWMGGLGYATASLLLNRGKNPAETIARAVTGFGWGAAATGAMQFGLNDGLDGTWSKHGGEFKWFTDGVLLPLTYAVAARSKPVQRVVLGSGKLLSKDMAIAIGLPTLLGGLGSLVGNGLDKGLKTEDRNPTYANWCQQGGLDSAAVAFLGGATYMKTGKLLAGMGVGLAAWGAARAWNAMNPHPTPANEFDKSLLSLNSFQKERSSEAMEEAISHLKEFGNFGRTDILKNPWDWQHPLEIPGNLHDQFVGRTKLRVNSVPTVPDLSLFAKVFPDSEHCKPGYSGTIAHAVVNFAAGDRLLKWGAVGVDKLLGDSVGQDTKIDLGGEALKKYIVARREIDQCIDYVKKHDGQVPEGEPDAKPINAEVELKMLSDLSARVDHAINEILGKHDNLDQIINEVKDRARKGHMDAVTELRADVRERAKYPKLEHPLTPRLQAKLCRDAAMIDLALAEMRIEGNLKFNSQATGDSQKQLAMITSPMPPLQVYFGEALDTLTWARTKMEKDDPAQADLNHIAQRAYALYQIAKQAGLPETAVMGQYLQRFVDGKLIDISQDYSNDAVNRAAIRNGRNPIADELRDYENPPQQTPADRQREKAAQDKLTQQQQAANQEGEQLQEQNSAMQQAEINYGNNRKAYADAHLQEEINAYVSKTPDHRVPSILEQQAMHDALMEHFDYLVRVGKLKPDGSSVDNSSQAPAPQSYAPQQNAVPQQTYPPEAYQPQQNSAPQQAYQSPSQPQPYQPEPSQPIADPRAVLEARRQQYMRENGGKRPTGAVMRQWAMELNLKSDFNMSMPAPATPGNPYQQWVPQQPVPVIHQATPDQQ